MHATSTPLPSKAETAHDEYIYSRMNMLLKLPILVDTPGLLKILGSMDVQKGLEKSQENFNRKVCVAGSEKLHAWLRIPSSKAMLVTDDQNNDDLESLDPFKSITTPRFFHPLDNVQDGATGLLKDLITQLLQHDTLRNAMTLHQVTQGSVANRDFETFLKSFHQTRMNVPTIVLTRTTSVLLLHTLRYSKALI